MDVGADFFSAVDLAALELPGLPARREHISRRATREKWKHEIRSGARVFPLSSLPSEARTEILHRRIALNASKAVGHVGAKRAPLATLAAMSSRQASRHSARTVVLEAFDSFRATQSARLTLDAFVEAFAQGHVVLADWVRADVKKLSRRTLERWLAAREKGEDEALAGRYAGGRKSTFELSSRGADFLIGAHCAQPLLASEQLLELLATEFPQGLPDANGVLLEIPSIGAVRRFLAKWRGDASNNQAFLAYTNPDRSRSHHRFAAGIAAQNIERPNQLWEIDASPADVLTSDGRQSIYNLVDVATRRMMAIVTATPRTLASLLLIARACQAWGVPEILGTDNGSDFTSKHFRVAIRQLGVHHRIAKPYQPQQKPFVERGIGTIQHSFMPLLPGFVGANVAERTAIRAREAFAKRLGVSDADAFDMVALGADELQERLSAWLANVYALRPHSGLRGRSPHEATVELIQRHPVRFADQAAIGMLLMPPADGGTRVVTKKGVTVGGIDYWCDRLIPRQRLQVRVDPADAGKVWLYTDTDPWRFVGIGLNPDLVGLDRGELAGRVRAQQAAIEKEGRARLRKLVREADIHSVADRLIGRAPAPMAANMTVTYDTPELEEAARAATHLDNVVSLPDRRDEDDESDIDRYARAKALRAALEAGAQISTDERKWLASYEQSHEFRGLKQVEDLSTG